MNMENNTIPPVDYAPLELQGELIAMQELKHEKLLEIISGKFTETQKESQLSLFSDHSDNQQSESERNNQLSESDKCLIKRAYAIALLYAQDYQVIQDNFKKKDRINVAIAWTKLIVSVNSTIDNKILNDGINQFDCVITNPPFQTKKHQCIELLLLDNLTLNKNSNELDRKCKCFIPVLNYISDSVNKAATDISKKFEVHRKSNTKSVFRQVFIENTENTNHTWEALEIHRDRIFPDGFILS
ncbi:MAG: hypothetical protein ACKPER_22165, partial [Dolichospermum sp.]